MEKLTLYVGSYGEPKRAELKDFYERYGDGVYRLSVDPETMDVEVEDFAASPGASYLLPSEDGAYLYVTREVDDYEGEASGAVRVFRRGEHLELLQEMTSGGAFPCHLEQWGKQLFVANYGGGSWTAYELAEGRIARRIGTWEHHGRGPNQARQEKAHAHSLQWRGREGLLSVADLGTDELVQYAWQEKEQTWVEHSRLKQPAGSGPRSQTLDAQGWLYVSYELASEVGCYVGSEEHEESLDRTLRRWSTLPDSFHGENTASELLWDPQEQYLIVGNRGHDSLALFEREGEGLRLVTHLLTEGATPRSFCLDPAGRWLVAANQDGESLIFFQRTEEGFVKRGMVDFPHPYCVRSF